MGRVRDGSRAYPVTAPGRSLETSPATVGEYLRRANVAGLSWPLPESFDDARLERRLFPVPPPSQAARPLPDWSAAGRQPLRAIDKLVAGSCGQHWSRLTLRRADSHQLGPMQRRQAPCVRRI